MLLPALSLLAAIGPQLEARAQGTLAADFSADPVQGCAPLEVRFTDLSSGPPTSWTWDFGDGSGSTEQNPTHSYTPPGSYTVTLTVGNGVGEDVKRKDGFILVEAAARADFAADKTSGCPPLAVQFTDLSTGDGLASWSWDFGDGGASTERSPSHAYAAPGDYSVSLTVRGDCGEAREVKTGLIHVLAPPAADFRADAASGCAPFAVAFTDRSSGDGIASWLWDFGDGDRSTARNPSHTYAAPGTYSVSLTVKGTCGEDAEVKAGHITVTGGVAADFGAGPLAGCAPLAVAFTDASQGSGLSSWSWDFGDGATSSLANPSHTYGTPGVYTVKLRVQGLCGEDVETKADFVAALAPPAADFKASVRSGCAPLAVTFTDASQGSGLSSWSWDFGDGATSAEQNPEHAYAEAGAFTVKLTVTGSCGEDTAARASLVRVTAAPEAPASIGYPGSAFVGDVVAVSWPESARAARYRVEASIEAARDWSEVCDVEDDPGLRDFSCTRLLDEPGLWRFRVRAVSSCGESEAVAGQALQVSPPAIFASWPLDGCVAKDVERGHDGRIVGLVSCASDRFGADRSTLRFRGDGFVEGGGLPGWDGDFTLSLWFLPRDAEAAPEGGAVLFQLYQKADAGAGPLRLAWSDGDLAVTVSHGTSGGIRFDGVTRDWHHLSVSRLGATLSAYLDGVPAQSAQSAQDGEGLGDSFAMGGAPGGASLYEGRVDDVLYESRPRGPDEVIDSLLARGGTVYLAPGGLAADISLEPGAEAEVLRIRLRTGAPRGQGAFALQGLRLILSDADPAEGGGEGFDFVRAITLSSLSRCDGGEVELTEVGKLDIASAAGGSAQLELRLAGGAPFQLPANAIVCLSVALEAAPLALPRDRAVRFSIESPGDLQVLDGQRAAFVAGQKRSGGPSVEGGVVHVLNEPPRLKLAVEAAGAAFVEKGPVREAALHEAVLGAGPTEGVRLSRIVYRPLEDTRVEGIREAVLLVEDAGGTRVVGPGAVDPVAQEVRFEDVAVEIAASATARLRLQADLEPSKDAAGASAQAPVGPAPRASRAPFALAGMLAAAGLLILRVRRLASLKVGDRRGIAPAAGARARLPLLASCALLAAGCGPAIIGGGIAVGILASGGGGGHGKGPVFTTRFQVGILRAEDVSAKGMTSGAPAVLDLGGEGGLAGPLFEVESR